MAGDFTEESAADAVAGSFDPAEAQRHGATGPFRHADARIALQPA